MTGIKRVASRKREYSLLFTSRASPTERILPSHRYETKDETAKEGEDYVRTTGTAIFAPGETTHEVEVHIVDDEGAR